MGMGSAPTLSPELTRQTIALARALSAAARSWSLYPPEHPSVEASVRRLVHAVRDSTAGAAFTVAVTPQTLLVAGVPLPEEPPVAEAAKLLHDRDILQLTFLGSVPSEVVHSLLRLVTTPADDLRAAGGPAPAWAAEGHSSIVVEQIDYEKILEERDDVAPAGKRDDVWRSLVSQIVAGNAVFDEAQQQRLLEISRDTADITDLASDVMAPKCTADGAPLITTQAATVLSVFRYLASLVKVVEPERLPEVMRNVAAATAHMDPHVVMQLMQTEDPDRELSLVANIATAFDDDAVAQMLATAMARDGHATHRLAQVFDTIAPDPERKGRVLRMARTLLAETDFGQSGQFKAAWSSMEELLVTYNEKPFVSDEYQAVLAGAAERGAAMAVRDLPSEWEGWVDTLKQDNVRRLSVVLVTDLLRLEEDADRAAEIATDMAALAEDLLLSGAFDDVAQVAKALREGAERARAVAPEACRAASAAIGASPALREAASLIGELDEAALAAFENCCAAIGAGAVTGLRPVLESEDETPAYVRARAIVRRFGSSAVAGLAPMADDPRWFVMRNAALLLGATRSAEAVPRLQALLRRNDPRVLRPAVSALAAIDDPAAARAIHTVLRVATGASRAAVVEALAAERNPRVVPMLTRILAESDPFGADHQTTLDALGALAQLADDRAVPPIAALMRRKKFFARGRSRALKRASVDALRAIGTPRARKELEDAARTGDRLLKKALEA